MNILNISNLRSGSDKLGILDFAEAVTNQWVLRTLRDRVVETISEENLVYKRRLIVRYRLSIFFFLVYFYFFK